jgi:hypothetical protein
MQKSILSIQKNDLQLNFVDSCEIMWTTNLIGVFLYERKESFKTTDVCWSIE